MTFIIIAIVAMAIMVILWTWHNLGEETPTKKIIWIIAGGLTSYAITLLILQISQSGIAYPNQEIKQEVMRVLASLFTVLTSGIALPYIAKLWDELKEENITKESWKKRMIIVSLLLIFLFWIETMYLTSIQEGMMKVIETQRQGVISRGS